MCSYTTDLSHFNFYSYVITGWPTYQQTYTYFCIPDLLSIAVLLAGCGENTNNYCECHAKFHSIIWSNLLKYN